MDPVRFSLTQGGDSSKQEGTTCKSNPAQTRISWHQNLPYYCVDGAKTASVYVALDTADAEVAVRFVKGSHRWKRLFHPRVFLDGSNLSDDLAQVYVAVPNIDRHPEDYDLFNSAVEPGDCILFDFRTLHGTGDAKVKKMRRAFSTRWMGDDLRYCERPGETSPPYTDHGMQSGDRMREDWFPVLWNRS